MTSDDEDVECRLITSLRGLGDAPRSKALGSRGAPGKLPRGFIVDRSPGCSGKTMSSSERLEATVVATTWTDPLAALVDDRMAKAAAQPTPPPQ